MSILYQLSVLGPFDLEIDWGDGSDVEVFAQPESEWFGISHTYAPDQIVDIVINGTARQMSVGSMGLQAVGSWGDLGCIRISVEDSPNLVEVPATLPSSIISMEGMFRNADQLNSGNVSNYDVSRVTDFQEAFYGALAFNQPLNWDTSAGTVFSFMLANTSFNHSINGFDFSQAQYMNGMLQYCSAFNQPIDITAPNCVTVSAMLSVCPEFNSPIAMRNMTSCTNWSRFLRNSTTFNQPLDQVDISAATNLSEFLAYAESMSQDLTGMNVEHIVEEPYNFAAETQIAPEQMPLWGHPPAG